MNMKEEQDMFEGRKRNAELLPNCVWTHFNDGSGDLEAPFKREIAQYDLTTKEFKINRGHWRELPDEICTSEGVRVFIEDIVCRLPDTFIGMYLAKNGFMFGKQK